MSGAKVSVPKAEDFNQSHVICIYNNDWLNQADVISMERAIR
jgi:hypothetical protein